MKYIMPSAFFEKTGFNIYDPVIRKRRKCMTKDEFIKKAIDNGVDNDSKNVWVVVDGYRYTTTIDDDEDQPYMASYYLETYTVSSAWDDLYEQYCCWEGIKI